MLYFITINHCISQQQFGNSAETDSSLSRIEWCPSTPEFRANSSIWHVFLPHKNNIHEACSNLISWKLCAQWFSIVNAIWSRLLHLIRDHWMHGDHAKKAQNIDYNYCCVHIFFVLKSSLHGNACETPTNSVGSCHGERRSNARTQQTLSKRTNNTHLTTFRSTILQAELIHHKWSTC